MAQLSLSFPLQSIFKLRLYQRNSKNIGKLLSSNENQNGNLDSLSINEILNRLDSLKGSKTNDKLYDDNDDSENDDEEEIRLTKELNKKLKEDEPPDWMIRLNLIGFTPLTYVGFFIAFVVLALNTYLGTGWASRLVGINDSDNTPFTIEKLNNGASKPFQNVPTVNIEIDRYGNLEMNTLKFE